MTEEYELTVENDRILQIFGDELSYNFLLPFREDFKDEGERVKRESVRLKLYFNSFGNEQLVQVRFDGELVIDQKVSTNYHSTMFYFLNELIEESKQKMATPYSVPDAIRILGIAADGDIGKLLGDDFYKAKRAFLKEFKASGYHQFTGFLEPHQFFSWIVLKFDGDAKDINHYCDLLKREAETGEEITPSCGCAEEHEYEYFEDDPRNVCSVCAKAVHEMLRSKPAEEKPRDVIVPLEKK